MYGQLPAAAFERFEFELPELRQGADLLQQLHGAAVDPKLEGGRLASNEIASEYFEDPAVLNNGEIKYKSGYIRVQI